MTRYLTIKELSAVLHIKSSTLYAWVAQGKIPFLRIHGLIRFRQDEIDQWLKSFRHTSVSPTPPPRTKTALSDLDPLIASATRRVYTRRHGETRPTSSLIRKEETDGAL